MFSNNVVQPNNLPLSLREISLQKIVLTIIRANLRWRRLNDVSADFQRMLRDWKMVPDKVKSALLDRLNEAISELRRWTGKHSHMFPEDNKFYKTSNDRRTVFRSRAFNSMDSWNHSLDSWTAVERRKNDRVLERCEHLRIFYDCIVWENFKLYIDDLKTARNIIEKHCKNWPQMKFQFACCYAMDDLLQDDYLFDKCRRRAFKAKLDDHPVYSFWLKILEDRQLLARLYRPDRLLIDQALMLVFQFAIINGFYELVLRLWNGLTDGQKEGIGFSCWKKICFSAEHREMVRFLCPQLCELNLQGMIRLTWDSFYDKVYKTLEDQDDQTNSVRVENLRKLECLLENWCCSLRTGILGRENFKALIDSVMYNRPETFDLFLDYMDKQQMSSAQKHIDKIMEKKKGNQKLKQFRQKLVRRQMTFD